MQQQYQCPNCGAPVAFGARFCGACGALLAVGAEEEKRGTNPWLIVLVIFIAIVFIGSGLLLIPRKSGPQSAPTSTLPGTTTAPTITSPSPSQSSVSLESIAITPASPQPLSIGSVQEFKATGKYSDGSTKDITSQVTWLVQMYL